MPPPGSSLFCAATRQDFAAVPQSSRVFCAATGWYGLFFFFLLPPGCRVINVSMQMNSLSGVSNAPPPPTNNRQPSKAHHKISTTIRSAPQNNNTKI